MLDAFPRGAPRPAFARLELVDLIDEDNAALRLVDVAIGFVDQPLQNGVDLLVDVAGLRERGRLRSHERDVEEARKRFAHQGLARSGGPDEKNVALGDPHMIALRPGDLLEMRIDGHRDDLLGLFLADHVLVQIPDDGTGLCSIVEHARVADFRLSIPAAAYRMNNPEFKR